MSLPQGSLPWPHALFGESFVALGDISGFNDIFMVGMLEALLLSPVKPAAPCPWPSTWRCTSGCPREKRSEYTNEDRSKWVLGHRSHRDALRTSLRKSNLYSNTCQSLIYNSEYSWIAHPNGFTKHLRPSFHLLGISRVLSTHILEFCCPYYII